MVKDNLKITGHLSVILTDDSQNVKQKFEVPNLVVSAGKDFIADRMIGTDSAVMSHMAVGTSNANLNIDNTTLETEIARVALTDSVRTDNTIRYSATFIAGVGTGALVEAGILNDGTAGDMLCRTTFPVVNKASGDTLTINWDVTIN